MMDERTAFERQLQREVTSMAGPEPRFDAAEITRSVVSGPRAVATRRLHRASSSIPVKGGLSMYSAFKFAAAAAIVALLGSFLLAGNVDRQPSDEHLPVAAPAQDGAMVVPVSGLLMDNAFLPEADYTRDVVGPVTEHRGFELDWTIEWSDPRLPTQIRVVDNTNEYPPSDANALSRPKLKVGAASDEAGTWIGRITAVEDEQGTITGQLVLEGAGPNDGLVAVLGMTWPRDADGAWDGFLVQGEMPPLPEPPSAE